MLRGAALQLGDKVQLRHGLAELLGAGERGERRDRGGPRLLYAPHGGSLRRVRGTPGPRLRRRPRPDRQALLHKLRRAPLRPGRRVALTPEAGIPRSPPPLSAFAVKVAAVQVIDYDDGKLLHDEPEDGLRAEILVGDDLGLLHAVGQERGRPLHGAEVDATVPAHRLEHRSRTRALADHAPQAAL